MKRARGFKNLVADGVDATTSLVRATHDSVRDRIDRVAAWTGPLAAPVRTVTRVEKASADFVYDCVLATNRLVQTSLEIALSREADRVPGETEEAVIAALNGVVGDHLARRGNDLDLRMSVRHEGREVDPAALATLGDGKKICVFVHGLACSDAFWRGAPGGPPSFAEALRPSGWTSVFLRYNSGRPVAVNGEALASLLDPLHCAARIVLIGHSMGGLVARSAVISAAGKGRRWLRPTTDVICLGTPHHGAPLEKLGNVLTAVLGAIDVPATQVIATVLNARSLGIKDLRFGTVTEADWGGASVDAVLSNRKRPHPWPDTITPHFIASTWARDPDRVMAQLVGDSLVRPPSATAVGGPDARRVPLWEVEGTVLGGISHVALGHHHEVFRRIDEVLNPERSAGPE
ncbi:MAG: alpha/beta fold hydrolase [Myxococcota bacterium]